MKLTFDVQFFGEYSAGLRAYTNVVTVEVEADPGGDPGEFQVHIQDSLKEWFDGASVEARK